MSLAALCPVVPAGLGHLRIRSSPVIDPTPIFRSLVAFALAIALIETIWLVRPELLH